MFRIKKVLCIALVASLALNFAGCGKKSSGSESESKIQQAKKDSSQGVYAETDFSITGVEGSANYFGMAGDNLYIAAYRADQSASASDASTSDASASDALPTNENSICSIYSVPKAGGEAKKEVEFTLEDRYLSGIGSDNEGNPMVFLTTINDVDNSQYKIYKIENNELKEIFDVAKAMGESNQNVYISGVFLDANNNIVVCTDSSFMVYDSEMNLKAEGKSDFEISVVPMKDGNLLVYETNYKEEKTSSKIKVFNVASNKYTEEKEMEEKYSGLAVVKGYGDYDAIIRSASDMFGYKLKDNSLELLLNYTQSYMNLMSIGQIYYDDDGTVFYDDYSSGENVIKRMEKVDPKDVADKVVLTLATASGGGSIKQSVIDYNKSQNKYKINLVDYSEESDPAAKLSADIAAGNIPDLYDMTYGVGNMTMDQCIAKDMIEDLTPFLEKDSDISADDFVPSVLESMKRNGKLYYMAPFFTVHALIGKASVVGEDKEWSYMDMKKLVDSQPDDVYIFGSKNKSDILSSFLGFATNDFIDWESGKCYFDSDEFKAVLEMANTGMNEQEQYDEDSPSEPTKLQGGKQLFSNGEISLNQVQVMNKVLKGDICYKGYPAKKGNGTYIEYSETLAMSTKCSDKDGAWDFIKYFETEDYQGKQYISSWGCPSRQDVFDEMVKTSQITKPGKDKYGNEIIPQESSMGWMDIEIETGPIDDKDADTFKNIVNSASGVIETNESVNSIIMEEAAAYFNGDKSLEDTVAVIQNRVSTYVNENK